MTLTVDDAAKKIHSLVDDQGFLGHDRNDHMHQVRDLLKQYGAADEDRIVGKLSDKDLHALADNVNSGGIFGQQGLNGGEKKDFFNDLAGKLDGTQLGRVASAFNDRGDVTSLADSVAGFASSQAKVDFIKSIAGASTSGDTQFDNGWFSNSLHMGDKEAIGIGKVLASMKNDPTGVTAAIKALTPDQLAAVVKAGEGETVTTYSGFGIGDGGGASASTTYDPAGLRGVLDAAAASNDPAAKASVFQAAAKAIGDIRGSDTLLTPNPGAGDAAKVVAQGMTNLLNSDTRGIVDQLNTADVNGKALTGYLQEVIRENPSATNPAIGRQIAQLQGAGTGRTAADFVNTAEAGANGDHFYRNAENLGYYSGAMQAAINKMNADTKTQGDILSNVFTTAVSVGTTAVPTLSVPAKVGAQAFNGLTREAVREVVADVTSGRKDLRDALSDLALPRAPGQHDRSRGPADPFFQSSANTVVLGNQ
jgi:hypothetical protein